jgi:hypothetical protein
MQFLPKMRFNKHTARAVVYGPKKCGEMGIKNLYVKQSLEQINIFMQHTRLESPLGNIMNINLDWVQLMAGIERLVFEDTRLLYHLEGEWSISIRKFLQATECQIKTTNRWKPQLEREKDKCIMDVIRAHTIKQGKKINRCRVCLQVTTIADIATEFIWGWTKTQLIANANQNMNVHNSRDQDQKHEKLGAQPCSNTLTLMGNQSSSDNH